MLGSFRSCSRGSSLHLSFAATETLATGFPDAVYLTSGSWRTCLVHAFGTLQVSGKLSCQLLGEEEG
jgi:hypothetical protein